MRHFDHLAEDVRRDLFHALPESFDRDSDRSVLAHALGATLYVPATRSDLATTMRRRADAGARSMVIDLEDAITDKSVDSAVASTSAVLGQLDQ
ncbi:MAG TPA: HpcH/HpaI aldolase/citrate lyase family protein, partial [Nakamurella multipartita]|nr:HpcH/HpaI aldolase/citrate lyase family protein [Nakamurella multipartita]